MIPFLKQYPQSTNVYIYILLHYMSKMLKNKHMSYLVEGDTK